MYFLLFSDVAGREVYAYTLRATKFSAVRREAARRPVLDQNLLVQVDVARTAVVNVWHLHEAEWQPVLKGVLDAFAAHWTAWVAAGRPTMQGLCPCGFPSEATTTAACRALRGEVSAAKQVE